MLEHFYGSTPVRLQRSAEAANVPTNLICLDPNMAEAHHQLGRAYDRLGQAGPTCADFERVNALDIQRARLDSFQPLAAYPPANH